MKSKDTLFTLVHSMSKSEKRHFKLRFSGTKKSSHIKLFDALSAQEKYDEGQLKRKFKDEKFIKHLPVIKNQLQEKILTSLNEQHSDKDLGLFIHNKLNHASILYQRGLYEQARKQVSKIKELIIEHEFYEFSYLLFRKQAIFWQQEQFINTSLEEIKAFELFSSEGLQSTMQEIEMLSAMQRFNKLAKTIGFVKSDSDSSAYHQILNESIFQSEEILDSSKTRYNYHFVLSAFYLLHKNEKKCIDHSLKALEITKEKAQKNERYINAYIGSLANTISYLITFRQYRYYKFFKEQLEKLKAMINNANLFGVKQRFETLKLAELQYVLLSDERNATIKTSSLILELETIDNTSKSLSTTSVLYYVAYGKFKLKKYRACLESLDLLNQKTIGKTNSLYTSAILLRIICHLSMRDFEYMEALLRNSKRALEKNNTYGIHEKQFFRFVKKLVRFQNNKDKLEQAYQDYLEYLASLAVLEWNANIYFNFEAWLRSLQKNS